MATDCLRSEINGQGLHARRAYRPASTLSKPKHPRAEKFRKYMVNIKNLQKNSCTFRKNHYLCNPITGNGVLAQLVERLNGIQKVRSSILLCSTPKAAEQSAAFSIHTTYNAPWCLCTAARRRRRILHGGHVLRPDCPLGPRRQGAGWSSSQQEDWLCPYSSPYAP